MGILFILFMQKGSISFQEKKTITTNTVDTNNITLFYEQLKF